MNQRPSACKAVGIARVTHYDWLGKDENYKKQVEDIENATLDFVEHQLLQNIRDRDTAATIFYLKTKGRKRGYTERQEIDLTNNIVSRSTPEEAARFVKGLLNECTEE